MNLIPLPIYSIIICTYNPDQTILQRCLNAVKSLNSRNIFYEVIIVDNNSHPALRQQEYIQQFVESTGATFLDEKKQGVAYARATGIKAAKGKHIIFFDDDNEPGNDYIIELARLHQEFPEVAAWGPGTVDVDFLGEVDDVLIELATSAFQDRHETAVTYSNESSWQPCYPYGTGLCISREYLLQYTSLVEELKFTQTSRNGGKLTSGEDVQMVLLCISKGAFAGVSPALKMNHIIPEKRGTLGYLLRLTYGTSECYSTCVTEVFPEYLNEVYHRIMPTKKFVRRVLKKYLVVLLNPDPLKKLDLVRYIGDIFSDYKAIKKPIPPIVHWVLIRLKAI